MNNRVRGDSFEGKDQRYNLITGLSGETEAAVGSASQERSLIPRWKGSVSRRRRKTGPHGETAAGETEDAVAVPWGHGKGATVAVVAASCSRQEFPCLECQCCGPPNPKPLA